MGVVREARLRTARTGTGQVLTTRQPPARGLPSLNLRSPLDNRAGNSFFTASGGSDEMAPRLRLGRWQMLNKE